MRRVAKGLPGEDDEGVLVLYFRKRLFGCAPCTLKLNRSRGTWAEVL